MKDEKDRLQKKNPKKNASSESESGSEYEESSSSDESYSESNSEETRSEELIQRREKTKPNPAQDKKKKHGMNATEEMNDGNKPLHLSQLLTQGSVAELHQNEEPTLAEAIRGSSEHEQNTIMLGSATVSLGRDDSGNLIVDGPPITASQPSIHPELEPPQQPPPQEEQHPQREEQSSQQPHPEKEVTDISSSSEDEHEPTPSRVFSPLIPKAE
ncbi:hypothetical protein PIB30_084526 [Stylosanthes scabra]|uniref:Uncharacterized protein n=1 Tax=Stylosanthes scabra TaxID=79078 RepID=A0ABU6TTX5_9FABA|nr:hypothetical protein [Stylosanthes scabra]